MAAMVTEPDMVATLTDAIRAILNHPARPWTPPTQSPSAANFRLQARFTTTVNRLRRAQASRDRPAKLLPEAEHLLGSRHELTRLVTGDDLERL